MTALASYLRDEMHWSAAQLAREAGVRPSTALRWCTGAVTIPAERAAELSKRLGIPRQVLRPDLWGAAPAPAEAA